MCIENPTIKTAEKMRKNIANNLTELFEAYQPTGEATLPKHYRKIARSILCKKMQ